MMINKAVHRLIRVFVGHTCQRVSFFYVSALMILGDISSGYTVENI